LRKQWRGKGSESLEGPTAEFGVGYGETKVNLGIGGYEVNAEGDGWTVGTEVRVPFQF